MSKLTKCKSCEKDVAKSARQCPHCGQKLKGGMLKKIVLWALAIFIALAVLGALVDPETSTNNAVNKSSGSNEAQEQPKISVGDTFQTQKYEISVSETNSGKSVGGQYFNQTASEGAIYVAVQWTYKNITTKPIGAFSTPDLYLLSPDGTRYSADIGATSSYATAIDLNEKQFSDLNPSIKVRTADVFEVSQSLYDDENWKLLIDADRKVIVDIN